MLKTLALSVLFLLSFPLMASPPLPMPTSQCSSSVTHVKIYRCICRANLVSVDERSQISNPITLSSGFTYLYSASDLEGNACTGTIAPSACNPAALNGVTVTGTYSCALGNTTDAGFEIK